MNNAEENKKVILLAKFDSNIIVNTRIMACQYVTDPVNNK